MGEIKMKKTVDELLQTPCWIIDILPGQVPKDSPGQYFAVEYYMIAPTKGITSEGFENERIIRTIPGGSTSVMI